MKKDPFKMAIESLKKMAENLNDVGAHLRSFIEMCNPELKKIKYPKLKQPKKKRKYTRRKK